MTGVLTLGEIGSLCFSGHLDLLDLQPGSTIR